MNNKQKCVICKKIMSEDVISVETSQVDYLCRSSDHFFAKRMIESITSKIKIRVCDKDLMPFFMRVDCDENVFQVWKKAESNKRTIIRSSPDIDSIIKGSRESIISKIKTYLAFS